MAITITQVRNAASLQSDNLRMDVEINHPDYGWIPYTVDPADTDTTIDNDAVMALIGSNFTAYVAPTQAELDAATATQARAERDNILTTVVDPLVSNSLGVPQQAGFPENITWPTEPQ
jgi:hypothetical protein